MQFSLVMFILTIMLMSPSVANAQSHHSRHDRCVRYDSHHRCTQWVREPERSSHYRVQVRVSYPPPQPPAYDPYGVPAGYYDPYAQYPQYGYGQQPYGQYYGGQPMYDPYYGGQPMYPGYQQSAMPQEMLIEQSEAATLARQQWEADRRASEQMARNAQMSAEALLVQKARLQAKLKATKAQLEEAEGILLMDDESAPESE